MERKINFKKRFCLVGFILTMFFLTACGNVEDDAAPEPNGDAYEVAETEEMGDWDDADADVGDWEEDSAEFEPGEASEHRIEIEEEANMGAVPILLPSESGRQLAYTVTFDLETTEFMSGLRLLWETVGEMAGYPEHELFTGRSLHQPLDVERVANFVIRIPNEQLSDFFAFIEENYNIVSYERRLHDFTFAYERTEDNLDTLREEEQRILDELDSDDETDITQADLAEVRTQIRDLEESNIEIQRDVDYSDVTIRLREVILLEELEEEPETFGGRLRVTVDNTLESLLTVLQVLLLFMITVLPWVLLIAIVVVPIIYMSKNYKQKKMAKMFQKATEKTEDNRSSEESKK